MITIIMLIKNIILMVTSCPDTESLRRFEAGLSPSPPLLMLSLIMRRRLSSIENMQMMVTMMMMVVMTMAMIVVMTVVMTMLTVNQPNALGV